VNLKIHANIEPLFVSSHELYFFLYILTAHFLLDIHVLCLQAAAELRAPSARDEYMEKLSDSYYVRRHGAHKLANLSHKLKLSRREAHSSVSSQFP
jgi:hypothetical protein